MLDQIVQNLHLVYITISFLTAGYLYRQRRNFQSTKWKKAVTAHTVVSIWTGIMYLNFSLQIIEPGLTYFADWIITTPLLVYAFLKPFNKNKEYITSTALMQSTVIGFGALTFITLNPGWFLISSAILAIVLYRIINTTFEKEPVLTQILAYTWLSYPFIYLAYNGNLEQATIPLLTVPLISKHVFALIHTKKHLNQK